MTGIWSKRLILPLIFTVKSFTKSLHIYKIATRTLRPTKVHRARRISKDSQSKPHSKHERRELKKNARMDNFWRKKDKKFNKNLSVRDLLQLFTTFEWKWALSKIEVLVIT